MKLKRIYRKAYRLECYAALALIHKDINLARFFIQERDFMSLSISQGF